MAMIAKRKSGYHVQPGEYDSTIVGVYDLGHQYSEKFKNESHKILFLGELADDSSPMPITLIQFYTLTLSEKGNLRTAIETLLGRKLRPEEDEGFDMRKLLGLKARLQVIDDNGKATILSMIRIPAAKPVPGSLPLIFFDMSTGEPIPEDTPEFVKKLIARSTEFKKGYPPPVQDDDSGEHWENENNYEPDDTELDSF